MSTENKRLSSLRLAAFVAPEAPMAAFIFVLVIFVPPVYAGSMGLGLATVGAIFGLTKLWDVVTDPAFGILSDRFPTRWGRRRPWLVVAVPMLILGVYKVMAPTPPVDGTYYATWMIFLYIGWTLATLSHISWAAELSTEYHERSRISGFKQAAGLLGLISIIIAAIADQSANFSDVDRLRLISQVLIVALPFCVLAALWAAPEPPVTKISRNKEVEKLKGWRVILGNGPMRRVVLANLLMGITLGAVGGMFLFYVGKVLQLAEWSSFALLPLCVSSLILLPVFVKISKRIGKHKTLCMAVIYQFIASFLFVILPVGNVVIACIAMLFLGASQAVATYIPAAIMADVTDFDAVKSGKQQTGLYMSFIQSTSKVAAALAVGISYPLLSTIGFDPAPDAVNTLEVLNNLRWLMVIFPGIMFALVVAVMWNFPLDEAKQVALRQQMELNEAPAAS